MRGAASCWPYQDGSDLESWNINSISHIHYAWHIILGVPFTLPPKKEKIFNKKVISFLVKLGTFQDCFIYMRCI